MAFSGLEAKRSDEVLLGEIRNTKTDFIDFLKSKYKAEKVGVYTSGIYQPRQHSSSNLETKSPCSDPSS